MWDNLVIFLKSFGSIPVPKHLSGWVHLSLSEQQWAGITKTLSHNNEITFFFCKNGMENKHSLQ